MGARLSELIASLPNIFMVKRPDIPPPPKEPKMATISESIIAAAHEGIEAQPTVSDIEKAARAIVRRMGLDPDAMGFIGPPRIAIGHLLVAPTAAEQRPLWTYFTRDAEAALNAVHK